MKLGRSLFCLLALCALAGVGAKPPKKKRGGKKVGAVSAAELAKAVGKGNVKKAKELLAAGASADYQNFGKGEGYTPLMLAVRKGHDKLVDVLLRLGPKQINLERVDKEGWSALMHAVDQRQFALAHKLLAFAKRLEPRERYPDKILNCVTKSGLTPLLVLAMSLDGSKDARTLFAAMARDGAGVGGFDERVQFLPQGLISMLAEKGEATLLRLVLKHGANVNEAEEQGVTPLMTACVLGNDDAAEVLIKAGANVTAVDGYGKTALHQAAVACAPKIIETLIAKGASLSAEDKEGATPLQMAESANYPGREKVLELLKGADGAGGGGGGGGAKKEELR
jgi:ankyrin repeat protein